jgi:hypothetical protein
MIGYLVAGPDSSTAPAPRRASVASAA